MYLTAQTHPSIRSGWHAAYGTAQFQSKSTLHTLYFNLSIWYIIKNKHCRMKCIHYSNTLISIYIHEFCGTASDCLRKSQSHSLNGIERDGWICTTIFVHQLVIKPKQVSVNLCALGELLPQRVLSMTSWWTICSSCFDQTRLPNFNTWIVSMDYHRLGLIAKQVKNRLNKRLHQFSFEQRRRSILNWCNLFFDVIKIQSYFARSLLWHEAEMLYKSYFIANYYKILDYIIDKWNICQPIDTENKKLYSCIWNSIQSATRIVTATTATTAATAAVA